MMGWMAPLRHRRAKLVFSRITRNREPSMSEITTIGLDLAKHVFQVHGIDAQGTTVLRKRLRRGQVLAFFSRIPRCVVGLEACATAHYWARELGALGHEVRLMPAQYVKAYIKRNKHDAADAEAICEAVQRPTMRFVPVKTAEQQAAQLLHRGREQLVRQRTMLVNALRAHLAEFGIVAAQGLRNVGELIAIVRDDGDTRLPGVARQVLQVLANQIEQIETAVAGLERQLLAWHKANPVSQRLASIRALGLSSPLPLPRRLRTRRCSARAASSPPGWAWCRGRIQPAEKPGWAASPSAATVICVGCSSMGQALICCDRRRRKPIRG
jgi:transposase